MKSRNGIFPLGLIGAITLAFSLVAFFLLNIERIAVNIWALAFLLLSECVLFCGLIGLRFHNAQHSMTFLKAGIISSLSLYFGVTVICVLFARFFKESLNIFILIELAIIALFAIIIVAILSFSRGIAWRNEEDAAKAGANKSKRGGF